VREKEKNRSWIVLVLFCTATTFTTAIALAIVFTSVTIISAAAEPAVQPPVQTFSGMITDAHCGAKHKVRDEAPAACTRICVKDGSRYVLVDGDKAYELRGDVVQLNRMAGERVTITGSLRGNTVDVTSMSVGP
jgi:hypothetical protein